MPTHYGSNASNESYFWLITWSSNPPCADRNLVLNCGRKTSVRSSCHTLNVRVFVALRSLQPCGSHRYLSLLVDRVQTPRIPLFSEQQPNCLQTASRGLRVCDGGSVGDCLRGSPFAYRGESCYIVMAVEGSAQSSPSIVFGKKPTLSTVFVVMVPKELQSWTPKGRGAALGTRNDC